jgi:hypothetical protein
LERNEKSPRLSASESVPVIFHISNFVIFIFFFLKMWLEIKKRPNKKKKGRKKPDHLPFSWVNVFQRDFLSSYSKQTHRRHLKETDGQTRQLKVLSLYFSISPFFFFVFLFLGFVLKFLLVSFFLISSSS